jgi:hypothetical protein
VVLSLFRSCATVRKGVSWIRDNATGYSDLPHASNYTITLDLTQPLREMNTKNLLEDKARLERNAHDFTTDRLSIV